MVTINRAKRRLWVPENTCIYYLYKSKLLCKMARVFSPDPSANFRLVFLHKMSNPHFCFCIWTLH